MLNANVLVARWKDSLIVRLGPEDGDEALLEPDFHHSGRRRYWRFLPRRPRWNWTTTDRTTPVNQPIQYPTLPKSLSPSQAPQYIDPKKKMTQRALPRKRHKNRAISAVLPCFRCFRR